MAENWIDEQDTAILDTIYYCETCNALIEPGDEDVNRHRRDLAHHKMRKVLIVRCGHCGNVVTDSYARYSSERNQFWCKNCIVEIGSKTFNDP